MNLVYPLSLFYFGHITTVSQVRLCTVSSLSSHTTLAIFLGSIYSRLYIISSELFSSPANNNLVTLRSFLTRSLHKVLSLTSEVTFIPYLFSVCPFFVLFLVLLTVVILKNFFFYSSLFIFLIPGFLCFHIRLCWQVFCFLLFLVTFCLVHL